ncbi:hypothetical protein EV424DRAFT_1535561 [Suillus variegatus]|nr:hypothetical protein EV424DRAFT_1535561 [Suillus variegatus]
MTQTVANRGQLLHRAGGPGFGVDLPFNGKKDLEARKWTIFGQIFGVRAATYLSFYSDSLTEVFIAGGIPPMVDSPYAAYGALVLKMEEQNKVYYSKYLRCSKHKKSRLLTNYQVRRILGFLEGNNVVIPNGRNLTVSRWQQLALRFGLHGSPTEDAGVIPVTHAFGGPLHDIVVPLDGEATGFHAHDPQSFANVMHAVHG